MKGGPRRVTRWVSTTYEGFFSTLSLTCQVFFLLFLSSIFFHFFCAPSAVPSDLRRILKVSQGGLGALSERHVFIRSFGVMLEIYLLRIFTSDLIDSSSASAWAWMADSSRIFLVTKSAFSFHERSSLPIAHWHESAMADISAVSFKSLSVFFMI